jgi:hypothetical protein
MLHVGSLRCARDPGVVFFFFFLELEAVTASGAGPPVLLLGRLLLRRDSASMQTAMCVGSRSCWI